MNTDILEPVSITMPPEERLDNTFAENIYRSLPVQIYYSGDIHTKIISFLEIEDHSENNETYIPSKYAILNALYFIQLLPEYVLSIMEEDDVYLSFHGTIIFDIEKSGKLLSVEIGDDTYGYFLEEENQIIQVKDTEPMHRFAFSSDLRAAMDRLLK